MILELLWFIKREQFYVVSQLNRLFARLCQPYIERYPLIDYIPKLTILADYDAQGNLVFIF